MLKRITIALVVCTLLIPAVAAASYRFGFGGRVDPVSGGLEFRLFVPLKEQAALFVAPHGIGVFTYDEGGQDIFYSAGLRGGVMFSQDKWFSPYVGLGFGSTGEIYGSSSYIGLGGRIYVGASIAPLQILMQILVKDKDQGFDRFRVELETGFLYRRDMSSSAYGTFEEAETRFWFPDIGFGISYNW